MYVQNKRIVAPTRMACKKNGSLTILPDTPTVYDYDFIGISFLFIFLVFYAFIERANFKT